MIWNSLNFGLWGLSTILNLLRIIYFAFDNNEVLNIAITAPKGAGKSSIINTYLNYREENGQKINAMNISVGSFELESSNGSETPIPKPVQKDQGNQKNGGTNTNKDKNQTSLSDSQTKSHQVEIKILNQIIHQINPENIPESRFHINREYKENVTNSRSLCLFVIALCAIYLLYYNLFADIYNEKNIIPHPRIYNTVITALANPLVFVAVTIVLAIMVFFICKEFFKNYTYKRFPKLTVKDCAIEPEGYESDSMFNKYLDEILYMLSHSNYTAIIFEDIERLNDPTIWEKLREINYILNKRIQNTNLNDESESEKKLPIKFVYVTIDSLFKGRDRVKFFDCIIPIVPIVDKSNSFDVISKMAKEHNITFNSMFLGSVTQYIDDMRMIINIFNEMEIYKRQLQNVSLNDNKLFAMLLFKNVLPKDFENFQYSGGKVYNILEKLETRQNELRQNMKLSTKIKGKILSDTPIKAFSLLKTNFNDEYEKIAEELNISADWNKNQYGLVYYLIAYGYISLDENEYISYFYPHTITEEEYYFLTNVKRGNKTNMAQPIKHADYIASKIGKYFDSVNILNFDLIYCVMCKMEIHQHQVFNLIKEYKTYDFISGFITYLEDKDMNVLRDFVIKLNNHWPEIFKDMQKKEDPALYKKYLELSLNYCDQSCFEEMNQDGNITDFLSNIDGLFEGEE